MVTLKIRRLFASKIHVIAKFITFMEADFNFFLFKERDLSNIVIVNIQKGGTARF